MAEKQAIDALVANCEMQRKKYVSQCKTTVYLCNLLLKSEDLSEIERKKVETILSDTNSAIIFNKCVDDTNS